MKGFGLVLLGALALQNCVATVLIRYAKKDVHTKDQFHNSSVVLHQEFLKLLISACVVVWEVHRAGGSFPRSPFIEPRRHPPFLSSEKSGAGRRGNLRPHVLDRLKEVVVRDAHHMLIPACLYTVQSILGFMALSTIDPASYQCFSQIRLLFTTCMSVAMLRRVVVPLQWLVLCLMTAGLIAVHLGKSERRPKLTWVKSSLRHLRGGNSKMDAAHIGGDVILPKIEWEGVLYVMLSCLATSYASVYLERAMSSSFSVAARNVQLSLFGILFALLSLFVLDIRVNWQEQAKASAECKPFVHFNIFTQPNSSGRPAHCQNPFYVWQRFDMWSTWGVVVVQALGGLLFGFTMAYSDSVMKCLATAVSTVASAGIAYVKQDFEYSWVSLVGGVMTLGCSYLFNVMDRSRKLKSRIS